MLNATTSSPSRSYEALAEASIYLLAFDLVFAHLRNGREHVQIVQHDGRHWRIEGRLSPTPHLVVMSMDN